MNRYSAGMASLLLTFHGIALATELETSNESVGSAESEADSPSIWYDDGLHLASKDGRFTAHIDWRAQIRYSSLDYDNDFGNPTADSDELRMNRARFKLGGQLGNPKLKYYTEYDLVRTTLLDLWLAPKVSERLGFRVGQFKVPYNRERFDSSGKQQFAERSIVTSPFTLDRQIGAAAMGRLFKGARFDSNYAVGVFLGNGRGGARDDDGKPMVFGRWQWNLFQQVLPFSQSDITRHQKPAASLAIGAATNRSAYTRFSTDGGGQLPGYPEGGEGQYDVDQAMIEFAFMFKGLSIQSEYHWKTVGDRSNNTRSDLQGAYFDIGYFFSELLSWVPGPLELAARYANVSPEFPGVAESKELSLGANWFFHGHRNKLTFDVTRRTETATPGDNDTDNWGVRLQWDVSF
jgi:phosphate-selective porin OprO/OprP